MRAPGIVLAVVAGLSAALPAHSFDAADPLSVRTLAAPTPRGALDPKAPCSFDDAAKAALSLADVVDRALCNNPQTRIAWANARVQAAQVGVARSAWLPTLGASVSASRNRQDGGTRIGGVPISGTTLYNQESAGLSAGYLLYDFGARDATLENALQTLAAANFTHDAAVQKVFLAAVQAYYQFFATRAAVDSAKEAERSSLESLKSATARYAAGVATPADKYQAQTANSQAVLNRIQAEGGGKSAEGALANVIGLDANRPVSLVAPTTAVPDRAFESNLDELIGAARKRRPDLAAAEAQVKAAQASVAAARAAGLPTISVSASFNYSDTSLSDPFHTQAVGISVNIPIFTGFNTTYRVQAAQAQVESQMAQRDSLSLQVALDVWQAYYTLTTNTQAVRSSADLVASASQSERVASGRYKAGAGTILDLLTAQSALASARLQNIQTIFNWYLARATLAQAMGQLDFTALDEKP